MSLRPTNSQSLQHRQNHQINVVFLKYTHGSQGPSEETDFWLPVQKVTLALLISSFSSHLWLVSHFLHTFSRLISHSGTWPLSVEVLISCDVVIINMGTLELCIYNTFNILIKNLDSLHFSRQMHVTSGSTDHITLPQMSMSCFIWQKKLFFLLLSYRWEWRLTTVKSLRCSDFEVRLPGPRLPDRRSPLSHRAGASSSSPSTQTDPACLSIKSEEENPIWLSDTGRTLRYQPEMSQETQRQPETMSHRFHSGNIDLYLNYRWIYIKSAQIYFQKT